jgi:formylglycine-generating enzyme required for sulfatase activity
MQLVCKALYEALQPGELAITQVIYEREGSASGILSNYLERVLSRDLQLDQRAPARRLLESLITSDVQRVIRTHAELVAELTARGVTPQTLDVILNQLVDSRLLRVQEGRSEEAELSYELAHDYLLREIKLAPEAQARKAAQELLEQEVRAYRRYRTLLTEERLAVIEKYRSELSFTKEAENLLAESQESIKRVHEIYKRRSILIVITTLLIALGLLGSGFYIWVYPQVLKWQAEQANPLIELPGGVMIFGVDESIRNPEEPPLEQLAVETFQLERTEVTNRQYALCLKARVCRDAPTDRVYFDNVLLADYPVVNITAYQAAKYCQWLGQRLPTEMEWERAARGLTGRLWPWGDVPPSATTANLISDDFFPKQMQPADSFSNGATPEGTLNLAGNVWEWTQTKVIETDSTFSRALWDGIENAALVARGGGFDAQIFRITEIRITAARASDQSIGFRCLRSVGR